MSEIRCRCCGVPVDGAVRRQVRVCLGCDQCDGLHGAQLQGVLFKAVSDGKITAGTAIARSLIDDAQITGRLVYHVKDGAVADITVPNPPPRWLVVAMRSVARNELPDFASLVDAVLGAYLPCKGTRAVLDAIAAELTEAFRFVDPSVMSVVVDSKRDALDPQHLIIQIQARTPTLAASVNIPGADDVVIPDDILHRKRAEA